MIWRLGRYAIYFLYGLDVEIRPKWTLPGSAPTRAVYPPRVGNSMVVWISMRVGGAGNSRIFFRTLAVELSLHYLFFSSGHWLWDYRLLTLNTTSLSCNQKCIFSDC